MTARDFYLDQVYPQLDIPLAQYPLVSLAPLAGYYALGQQPLVMLVAFTGAGKTTALNLLPNRTVVPPRREVADWIAIPMAQAIRGEPLRPVTDRVQRFHYTRLFAQQVAGGMARAFSWLNLAGQGQGPILTEGIRGENEIEYALRHFPRWQIIELTLHPIVRLQRLSGRQHDFDRAGADADLSFLPAEFRSQAQALLKSGRISPKALTIVRAEAANYGLRPFAEGHRYPNYHHLQIDRRSPEQVAHAVWGIMAAIKERADAKN